jgi:hypothetical protein
MSSFGMQNTFSLLFVLSSYLLHRGIDGEMNRERGIEGILYRGIEAKNGFD